MKVLIKKKSKEVVNRNEKGFTIVELIIVIVIAGIMAAIAIPRMNEVSEVDIYTAARQVKSEIRYAQELAMSKYTTVTITFNGGAGTYAITGNGINPSNGDTISGNLPDNSYATFDAGYAYMFNSSGVPTALGGAGWNVGITSRTKNEQVVVSPITGQASIP
ncbi:MAG: prepilin-type N-terminal cleavage/methylation domain-containing protein [Planctomycetota bacterium]|jgi:prepilin-type N-terminal cleavage/methylation domain-containing protein